jgi:predicted TIM-barrel fold metal-dependent hydrolase
MQEVAMSNTDVRKIRARLKHPIIDADGHWAEFHPHMRQEFRKIGGDLAVEAFEMAVARIPRSLNMSVAERAKYRIGQEAFWFLPTKNTLDRATAMMPKLLYERLDELGLDFCVIYPTYALGWYRLPSEKHRRALVRAYNTFTAEQFRPYADRIIPAAIIPMYSPEEAIEELEYASKQLGLRVCMTGSIIRRPMPASEKPHPDALKSLEWYDVIGIDSIHDYDPVWAKFRELKIAPSFHQSARSILLRNSPSNFCYNHIGHFASASEAMAKALFFGGVTRRFPELNFGFLEGGVGWACSLYADLIGHWEKRNLEGLENTNPARLDRARMLALAEKYAKPEVLEAVRRGEGLDDNGNGTGGLEHLDDYWRCEITRKEDFKDLYVKRYYFGCEADDPINAWAFNKKALPMGARLNAFTSMCRT